MRRSYTTGHTCQTRRECVGTVHVMHAKFPLFSMFLLVSLCLLLLSRMSLCWVDCPRTNLNRGILWVETAAELNADPKRSSMINASNPHEVVLSTQVATLWRNMAAYGAPDDPGGAHGSTATSWPKFTLDYNRTSTMVFGYTDPPGQAAQQYRSRKCDFWDSQFAKLLPHLL